MCDPRLQILANRKRQRGMSLIEVLIGSAVFVIIALAVYQAFSTVYDMVRLSRQKTAATLLANEQFEIVHNLPYASVGTIAGLPPGVVPQVQTLTRAGVTFTLETDIYSLDDPFDGTIGGTPNDLSPADYKLVEITVSCASCKNFTPIVVSGRVAPKNLETASTNGALFIQAFDANGLPVNDATVHVVNNLVSPAVDITDTTNAAGMFQIIDAPPYVEGYQITVNKSGYSESSTTPRTVSNPNPTIPFATVATQAVTSLSFAIDRVSSLSVSSMTPTCSVIPSVDFSLTGSKLVGAPNILKYGRSFTTLGATGLLTINNLEWDNYRLVVTEPGYDLVGTNPLFPLNLLPNSSQDVKLILSPADPDTLLIAVKDGATGLPISGADVRLTKPGFSSDLTTGEGYLTQTDWSGGSGQADFVDGTKYFSGSVDMIDNLPSGELHLRQVAGLYQPVATLESSTFDTGGVSNFDTLTWEPVSQPIQTGPTAIRFQVATNNDNATWNYVGPDGTAGTYFVTPNTSINASNSGKRYFRYKLFMSTDDPMFTPSISDVSFTFSSACTPPGQVAFRNLSPATYTIHVEKSGYADYDGTILVNSSWRQTDVTLTP